jgi:hypothetical protein
VVTAYDAMGNKVAMERAPDGTYKAITPPDPLAELSAPGPGGLTWAQAEERATREAKDKAGWLSRDSTDFGKEGRQGFITRRAQELYQGGQPAAPASQGASGKIIRNEPPSAVVKTDADYEALPSGTVFMDPTGQLRRKP